MPRGRPVFSQVRQNIIEILAVAKKAYGYEIYAMYREIFPQASLRLIYYHLKKGVSIGELKVHKVVMEKGEYSWGTEAEKTYYALGDKAEPKGDKKVTKIIERRHKPSS